LAAITNVCREKLQIKASEACDLSFYAEGAFNKLYLVHTRQQELLMRVLLAVYPRSKTRGEVTTLRFLRRETDLPVPEVIAFDDSCENEVGFEWIFMELMPGVSAYKKWRTLTMSQKGALVRVAELQAQIFRHTFSGIGTLTVDGEKGYQNKRPGEMVSRF
jgi:aminoglycoside phosphotransferase (APT) family kinase protein